MSKKNGEREGRQKQNATSKLNICALDRRMWWKISSNFPFIAFLFSVCVFLVFTSIHLYRSEWKKKKYNKINKLVPNWMYAYFKRIDFRLCCLEHWLNINNRFSMWAIHCNFVGVFTIELNIYIKICAQCNMVKANRVSTRKQVERGASHKNQTLNKLSNILREKKRERDWMHTHKHRLAMCQLCGDYHKWSAAFGWCGYDMMFCIWYVSSTFDGSFNVCFLDSPLEVRSNQVKPC